MKGLDRFLCLVVLATAQSSMVSGQRLQLAEPATDSTFPVASCGDPTDPSAGRLNVAGVIGYTLLPNGVPDTSSVRIVELEFMSVAGFRSAVVRRLSDCRMTFPFGYQGGPIAVRQEIEYRDLGFAPAPARRVDSLPQGMAIQPVPIDSSAFPFPLEDSRVEEHPWQLRGCMPQGLNRPTGVRYRTREEAEAAGREWNRLMAGKVVLQVTVDAEGRVVPGSDSVVVADNPASANALIASLLQCRYLPARIGGVPVPAKALARMTLLAREP